MVFPMYQCESATRMYMNVYRGFIHNHQKLENTQLTFNQWRDKQTVVNLSLQHSINELRTLACALEGSQLKTLEDFSGGTVNKNPLPTQKTWVQSLVHKISQATEQQNPWVTTTEPVL